MQFAVGRSAKRAGGIRKIIAGIVLNDKAVVPVAAHLNGVLVVAWSLVVVVKIVAAIAERKISAAEHKGHAALVARLDVVSLICFGG